MHGRESTMKQSRSLPHSIIVGIFLAGLLLGTPGCGDQLPPPPTTVIAEPSTAAPATAPSGTSSGRQTKNIKELSKGRH
jgi:hypothetical protein